MAKKRDIYQNIDYQTMGLIYVEIGRRIKKARLNQNLTQQDLSNRINLSRTSITNLEKGFQKVTLHTLFEISLALKVDVHSLLPNLYFREASLGKSSRTPG
jgi:transcriptional regulator with XRE-family HTH domain